MTKQVSETLLFSDGFEAERTRQFGSPSARRAKIARYISGLVRDHGEELIRQVLAALSEVEDFIPANDLKAMNPLTAPLHEMLRPYDLPWFEFEEFVATPTGEIHVTISYGFNLAAVGESFTFVKNLERLELVARRELWLS